MNKRHCERLVHLAAQPVDIDFNQIGEGSESFVPDVLGNLFAPDDAPAVTREIFEQGIFLRGELNQATRAMRLLPARVYCQIGDVDDSRA